MLISAEPRLAAMSMTIRPRALSWSATACLLSASTSPFAWPPAMSIALKTKLAMAQALRRPLAAGAHRLCHRDPVTVHLRLGSARAVAGREPVQRLDRCRRGDGGRRGRAEPGPAGGSAAEQTAQLVRRRRARLGHLRRDPPRPHERRQRRVHRLHAVRASGLDRRVDLVRLALADLIADRGRGDQDLARGAAAGAVGGRDERLGDDALERNRQLHADLALLVGREDVDDAVDRLRGILGVERGEHQVPGLRRGDRGPDRLEVAHLADEDHVGVLAQRGTQGGGERGRVRSQLALVDQAVPVPVEELDRVLDRDDVVVPAGVDLVDQRRQRRRLARARRPGEQHQPARLARELVHDRRQAQLVDRGDLGRDQAERGAERGTLEVRVDPEPRPSGDRVGEVDLPVGLEPLALAAREDRVDDLPRLGRVERRVVERLELPAHAHGRRRTRGEVQVRGAPVDDLHQDFGEVEHGCDSDRQRAGASRVRLDAAGRRWTRDGAASRRRSRARPR